MNRKKMFFKMFFMILIIRMSAVYVAAIQPEQEILWMVIPRIELEIPV